MAEHASKDLMFIWEGTDKRGVRIKGESKGVSIALIKADLRRQGINPLKVKKKPTPLFGKKKKKITPKEIAVFSRQLATMMASGVPLVQSFEIVGRGHENPSMQELIMAIKGDVESGGTLAEALAKHPRHFDALTCNLVHAGEQAGILETLLNKIATYKEKVEGIKGKIKKAMFYPVAIVIVAFIVTGILLYFVVPQFQSLFQGFGADLPALTQLVVNLSNVVQAWWWAILLGVAATVYGLLEAKRRIPAVQNFIDRAILKVPVFGDILVKATIARFARTLRTMFSAGVPLVEAMDWVAGAAGNVVYAGGNLQDATTRYERPAPSCRLRCARSTCSRTWWCRWSRSARSPAPSSAMLAKVADFYEEEVDNSVDASEQPHGAG